MRGRLNTIMTLRWHQNDMKKHIKTLSISAGLILVVLVAGYFYFIRKPQNQPFTALRCPDYYQNSQDRLKAFDMFVSAFYELHPGATYADLSQARHDFYVEFKCTAALKRESDYLSGNLDEETKQAVQRVMSDTFGQ